MVNETTGKVYVTNSDSNNLSILYVPVDPDRSIITAIPSFIRGDGASTSLITVIPKDSDGNDLGTGRQVTIRSTAGFLQGTVSDNGDGTYTQVLKSEIRSVTATISATVDGTELSSHPKVFMIINGHPSIHSANPSWGFLRGGTQVTIEGEDFGKKKPDVLFGTESASVLTWSDHQIECITPPQQNPGLVEITVTNNYNNSKGYYPEGFEYVDPNIVQLRATRQPNTATMVLTWKACDAAGAFTVIRSTTPDFSSDLATTPVTGKSFSDASTPPTPPGIYFYRVEYQ